VFSENANHDGEGQLDNFKIVSVINIKIKLLLNLFGSILIVSSNTGREHKSYFLNDIKNKNEKIDFMQ